MRARAAGWRSTTLKLQEAAAQRMAVRAPLLYVVTPQFAAQAGNLKRNRPATEVAVFERAGHALFVDEPDRFNALLEGFVARVP